MPKGFLIKTALNPLSPVVSVMISVVDQASPNATLVCQSLAVPVNPGVLCSPNTGAVPCIPKFLISFLFAVVGSQVFQLFQLL